MTDTSAPPAEPYDVDDRVRVRLADGDAESPFEDAVGRVVHVFTDEPGMESAPGADRELDRASYRLEDAESGDVLPVVFRHRDLIPADEA
jgi:hypothetical protein